MTSRKIEFERLEELKEKSADTVAKKKRREELKDEINKLNDKVNELKTEVNNITNSFPKQSYSDKERTYLFEDFGVLTCIKENGDTAEGHIMSFDGEFLEVRTNFGCNDYSAVIVKLDINELKEKGFIAIKGGWIIDDIKETKYIIDILARILEVEKGKLLNEKKLREDNIKKSQSTLKEINNKLIEFDNVSDSKMTRTFNKVSFGMTKIKIEEILKQLPREVKI